MVDEQYDIFLTKIVTRGQNPLLWSQFCRIELSVLAQSSAGIASVLLKYTVLCIIQ